MNKAIYIAHRGYSGRYPENTLLAYQKAYEHGARWFECDLQLTSDLEPVLHHDVSLKRMSGVDLDILDINAQQLTHYQASYPERFEDEFKDNTFTFFNEFCNWLKKHPDTTAFIEFKQESIEKFGLSVFIDKVYHYVHQQQIESQCVFISFNPDVVDYTHTNYSIPCAWVLPNWNHQHQQTLAKLQPKYVFCDINFLPEQPEQLWHGNWLWAIYNVDDKKTALAMQTWNIDFFETNQIATLLSDKHTDDK